jgi:hypothetical protein
MDKMASLFVELVIARPRPPQRRATAWSRGSPKRDRAAAPIARTVTDAEFGGPWTGARAYIREFIECSRHEIAVPAPRIRAADTSGEASIGGVYGLEFIKWKPLRISLGSPQRTSVRVGHRALPTGGAGLSSDDARFTGII